MDFSSGWGEGEETLGNEEGGFEAKSVQGTGDNKHVQRCISKLLLFNDLEWS